MPKPLHLLPAPRAIAFRAGTMKLPSEIPIILNPHEKNADIFAGRDFARRAAAHCRTRFRVTPRAAPGVAIRVIHDGGLFPEAPADLRAQAYRLVINPRGIDIASTAPAGTFYAFQTLLQILREIAFRTPARRAKSLPCLTITDHPDFPCRGFYHDTARGKVPKLKTLLQLVDDLAHLKYNQFQLYIENNYQFRKHPDFYSDTTPLTSTELQKIDAACRERHIDFVPSLTSLGHFDKILCRPRYRALAEAQPEQLRGTDIKPDWINLAPWSLCVTDPRSKKLLREMYDEFLPNFTSPRFNICCDESFDLGYGRSARAARKIGRGRLYLNWIHFCHRQAGRHGRTIQLWGDIIQNHPELVDALPSDATLLEWGYEAGHPFDDHCAAFRRRAPGLPLYVCPGTSSWLTFASRTRNALANIHNAAAAGLKHGARGLLLTDWGDRGHQQMLAVSLLSLGYAAGAAWNLPATPHAGGHLKSVLNAISIHVFRDARVRAASLAYDLGLTYERLKCPRPNASAEWFLFREPWKTREFVARTPAGALRRVAQRSATLRGQLRAMRLARPDGAQVVAELAFSADEIRHACRRTLARQGAAGCDTRRELARHLRALRNRFGRLWLARNKPSRLVDILGEFDRLAAEYGETSA